MPDNSDGLSAGSGTPHPTAKGPPSSAPPREFAGCGLAILVGTVLFALWALGAFIQHWVEHR